MKTMELKSAFRSKSEWYDYVNGLEEAGILKPDGANKMRETIHNSNLP